MNRSRNSSDYSYRSKNVKGDCNKNSRENSKGIRNRPIRDVLRKKGQKPSEISNLRVQRFLLRLIEKKMNAD